MGRVSIRSLSKRFGGKIPSTAVDDLGLDVEAGEFLVLLGPSGCGKTTTLRCIAGLESPDEGEIALGDRVVFDAQRRIDLAPNKRRVGMVFQSYALWPHMTVRKNIGYPLRARRVPRDQAAQWIEEVARLVECSHLLDRYPSQLSGGQQQRVALCRGLVARPELMLFDEPLSNLDARLRQQVRGEIHELHQQLEFTAVYVTHDQSEALALGDRLAIMREGKIEQLDTPAQVFEAPTTEYVAEFIGMSNRLTVELRDGEWWHKSEAIGGDLGVGGRAESLTLRAVPEDLHLMPPSTTPPRGAVSVPVTVVDSEFAGRFLELVTSVDGTRLYSRMAVGGSGSNEWIRRVRAGERALAVFRRSQLTFFDVEGTRLASNTRPGNPDSAVVLS